MVVALAHPSARAEDLPVALELVLAVDVSASMDADERRLQRQGYIDAFRSSDLMEQVRALGVVAVTYFEWGDEQTQTIIVPWTLVTNEGDARRIAERLESAPVGHSFGTSIAGALSFANALLDDNGFLGIRRAIDISGDGPNTVGSPVIPARDAVLAAGVTINGLPIMIRQGWSTGLYSTAGLDLYYEDCVIGGPGAFIVTVKSRETFGEAIKRKLILELMSLRPRPLITSISDKRRPRVDCLVGEKGSGRILPLR
jgi:hypothetical protein